MPRYGEVTVVGLEPLRGEGLCTYKHMARKLGRVMALLDGSAVAEVIANYVFRVAVHGVEAAVREHQVPSALARGIAVGLFHAEGFLREKSAKRGQHG